MCKLNNPDCLNCPYPECNATIDDIKRQWKHSKMQKLKDNPDSVPAIAGASVKAIKIYSYTEEVKARQDKYNRTLKGKARLKKYYESEKGKENERRKMQRRIATGKNAESCKRYRERKKSATKDMQNV